MILGFGEIMARLAPPERRRWRQALPGSVEVTWGGGEANVCAAGALWGHATRFVTALPNHPIADSLEATLRGLGVDTNRVVRREGRLGLYFVEVGANQRGSTVIYDREGSAVSRALPEEYDFDRCLEGVEWIHVTGITPAISEPAFRACLTLAERAKSRGLAVSCDLNFRKKLWNWRAATHPRELARQCMAQLLRHVDVVIGNEEDAADVLDIHAAGSDVLQGRIDPAGYVDVARRIVSRFPDVRHVAITLRESVSADHNNWGALLFDAADRAARFSPRDESGGYRAHEIRDIVDRIGAGDSFAAGLIHGLRSFPEDHQRVIDWAVAASCLKHTIHGDFAYLTTAEVDSLAGGDRTGRVQR